MKLNNINEPAVPAKVKSFAFKALEELPFTMRGFRGENRDSLP